jgi:peptidoglycan/xylan/chitin deacetylase (PgdA/CDA1 family)
MVAVVFRVLCLSAVLLAFGSEMAAAAEDTWRVPVLVYHRFGPEGVGLTTVRTSLFAEQLEWLHTHNVSALPLHRVTEAIVAGTATDDLRGVVITADDGHFSIYNEMYPLLQRYGVHATLFIYPSAISNSKEALTWDQLADMVKSGLVDVQSHTYWHPIFEIEKRRLGSKEYEAFVHSQLTLSKQRLETNLGIKVDLLAWPFGLQDSDLARDAADAGYVAAFTIERKALHMSDNRYALPRILITEADSGERFAALVSGAKSPGVRP